MSYMCQGIQYWKREKRKKAFIRIQMFDFVFFVIFDLTLKIIYEKNLVIFQSTYLPLKK